jgi:alpha-1,6-mannosyltransferase
MRKIEMLSVLLRNSWPTVLAVSIATGYGLISYISHQKPEQSLLFFLLISGIIFLLIFAINRYFSVSKKSVFFWALAFHMIGFLGLPLFEDDHYRYLWDGYRTVASGSPYGIPPENFFNDKNTPPEINAILSGINYPEVPTIYGPALQGIFASGFMIAPGKFWPIKAMLVLANLCLIFLLLKHADAKNTVLYAWNPLVFKEIALTGHPDGLVALMILIAWLTRSYWKQRVSSIIFGLALAVKISVLPALAWFFWKRQYSNIVIAIGVFFLCYLPFIGAGSDWSGFKVFASEWEFNSGVYAIVAAILPTGYAKVMCLGTAGLAMLWLMKPSAAIANPPWHRLFGILLLLSPVVNAWYLLWFLALASLQTDRWPWCASALVLLSYVTGQNLGDETISTFSMPLWARITEWILLLIVVCFDVFKKTAANPFASPPPLSHH